MRRSVDGAESELDIVPVSVRSVTITQNALTLGSIYRGGM